MTRSKPRPRARLLEGLPRVLARRSGCGRRGRSSARTRRRPRARPRSRRPRAPRPRRPRAAASEKVPTNANASSTRLPARELLDARPERALVEVEARLLPEREGDDVAQAALGEAERVDARRRRARRRSAGLEALELGGARRGAIDDGARRERGARARRRSTPSRSFTPMVLSCTASTSPKTSTVSDGSPSPSAWTSR